MIVTVDTNILVYAVDGRWPEKASCANRIIDRLMGLDFPLAIQVCGEFYRASTAKLKIPPLQAAQIARNYLASFPTFRSSRLSTERALAEAAAGRFSFWDANLVTAAEAAGVTHLVSEDMGDGRRLGALEIVAPFSGHDLSPRLRDLLDL